MKLNIPVLSSTHIGVLFCIKNIYTSQLQGGSNMTWTDLCVNSPGHIWTTLYICRYRITI